MASLSGDELLLVATQSTPTELESLYQKYTQPLLLSDGRVYILPPGCLVPRYFGGASEGELLLAKMPVHTRAIAVSQEVFEAKDEREISKKIACEKSIALVEGKVAKAFLQDNEGRAFGGASERVLDFSFQKKEAVAAVELIEKKNVPSQGPSCQLLEDGSSYVLENLNDARFYSKKGLVPVNNSLIKFE
ncbi:MAG: hypothetical protein IBX43_03500 [Campylobacterales bacterium]|nr:hypothetical protein [Campylobacterales bacterium]